MSSTSNKEETLHSIDVNMKYIRTRANATDKKNNSIVCSKCFWLSNQAITRTYFGGLRCINKLVIRKLYSAITEKLVGDVYKDKLFGKSIEILKLLYDEDILEEGVIIDWANKPSKKYITKEISKKLHEKVEPFINWLKNAKEESDDDEKLTTANDNETTISNDKNNKDSLEFRHRDEEDFLEFSHRVSRIELVDKERHQKIGSETNLTNGDDDDDLDIDNI
jgi:hypothetical protein